MKRVQTYAPRCIDVWMVDLCQELTDWRLEWVVQRNPKSDVEYAAFVWCIEGSGEESDEVLYIANLSQSVSPSICFGLIGKLVELL